MAEASPVGINIFGYVYSHNGLGVATRNLIDALVAAGHPLRFVALAAGEGWDDQAAFARLDPWIARVPSDLIHPVHLIVGPPATVENTLGWIGLWDRTPRIKAAYTFWELELIPERWRAVLHTLDATVGCTHFMADVLRAALPNRPVHYAPQPLDIDASKTADRRRFGIPDGAVVFCCAFNLGPDLDRKNPQGTIQAFTNAFSGRPDRVLLLKATVPARPAFPEVLRELEQAVAGHPTVRLMIDEIAYDQVLSLYASVDVFVSLHRSEGLGLGMLESMLLGKPVIATAYSGNMSFMNESTAALVGYKRVPVASCIWQYAETRQMGAKWAEPDLSEAASWMRRLALDPDLRRTLGQLGREAARSYVTQGLRVDFAAELGETARQRGFFALPAASEAADNVTLHYRSFQEMH